MDQLRYQVDLLNATNQKLSVRERMYRLICDTAECAYIYYSYEKNEIVTKGLWKEYFDFELKEAVDIVKLYEMIDEPYTDTLKEVLFLENSGEEYDSVECLHKNKKTWLKFTCEVVYEKRRPTDKIIVIQNVTKQKSQQEELKYISYYDTLTGLYNRNYFVSLLGGMVRDAKENNSRISVLVIDIDDFHKVNDGLGMIAGDELVQQFGFFLRDITADNVITCHLASDIYCMAIQNPSGEFTAEAIHRKIQERTKRPFVLIGGQMLAVTVSIGVAEFPEAADTALELINCAEIVMYKGKSMGKNTIQYFDTPILQEFLKTVELDNKLKEAVFANNFLLYFQPQYYVKTKKLRGMEALIRWRDDDGHMISPQVFIPVAEKNRTIIPIGNWVMEQSIRYYAKWSKQYHRSFIMSINISSIQYGDIHFVDFLLHTLEKYQVNPEEIELEITESILIEDFVAVTEKLQLLRSYGIRISIDDFGTGFSSLTYLRKLPINTLKIDKSFIDTVLTDSTTRIITKSIISMVQALGYETIAEGVEEEEQFKYLHGIGCDVIQGYLLGHPQSPEQIEALLQELQNTE